MTTLTEEIPIEIDEFETSSHFIPLKYRTNNLAINVSFVLKFKTRLILSNPNEQVTHEFIEEFPMIKSPNIKWIQEKGLSTKDMRNKLYRIGVRRREIQNLAINKVKSYVDRLVKRHNQLLWYEPIRYLNRLQVELVLPIYWVAVHRGVLIERGPKPADALAVRDLKRVRVEESTIDSDEQCSVCYEKLVEQEQLIVLPCEHAFHEDCVSQWLKISNMCPLCRFELPPAQEIETTSTSYQCPLRRRRFLRRLFSFLFGDCLMAN